MGDRTNIEWTESTWNPIRARSKATGKVGWHCTHVSEGCRHCYAENLNMRLGTGLAYKPGHAADIEVFVDEKMLLQPLRWRRPRMIFVGSMTDLFADFVSDKLLDRVFAVMAIARRHTFQVLTKRSDRLRAYLSDPATPGRIARACVDLWLSGAAEVDDDWPVDSVGPIDLPDDLVMRVWPLPNLWLGTSCEDQAMANLRVPDLLATPAAIRFVSAEPLLGPIDFARICLSEEKAVGLVPDWQSLRTIRFLVDALRGCESFRWRGLDWIIVGGESGPKARPMHPAWAREIRDQCAAAGVAFLFKQHGEWADTHPDWPRATASAIAYDGTLYRVTDLAYPDGPRYVAAIRAGHDKAQLTSVYRVGKKAAGRLLDGITHDGMPEVRAHG